MILINGSIYTYGDVYKYPYSYMDSSTYVPINFFSVSQMWAGELYEFAKKKILKCSLQITK